MKIPDMQVGNGVVTLYTPNPKRPAPSSDIPPGSSEDATMVSPVGTYVSRPAEFFKKLQELIKSDPAKAQQFLTEVSQHLRQESQAAGPGHRGDALGALANRFDKAARTGDISALQEPQAAQQGGKVHRAYTSNQEPHALLELLDKEMGHIGPTPAPAQALLKTG